MKRICKHLHLGQGFIIDPWPRRYHFLDNLKTFLTWIVILVDTSHVFRGTNQRLVHRYWRWIWSEKHRDNATFIVFCQCFYMTQFSQVEKKALSFREGKNHVYHYMGCMMRRSINILKSDEPWWANDRYDFECFRRSVTTTSRISTMSVCSGRTVCWKIC